jgi:lysophospholipase L1-like esterase
MGPILGGFMGLRVTTDFNIVFHGNSLIYGRSGATVPTGAMPYQVQRLPPVNNLVTCVNMGLNGQQWDGMLTGGSGAAVDALFDSSKTNILVAWEGTNYIRNNSATAAQAFAAAQEYTTQRKTVHPGWKIIHMTLLPIYYQTYDDATAATVNAIQNTYSQLLRDNWRSMCEGLVDVQQAGSPFLLPNYNRTTFQAATYNGQSIWSPNDQQGGGGEGQNQFVHPSDTGYAAIAQMVASTLRRVSRH